MTTAYAVGVSTVRGIAVYPGSFDPPTNGHVDVARRAAAVFERLIVAVLDNPAKQTFFSVEERVAMLTEVFADCPGVEVRRFSGLLVDFMAETEAGTIIRGLRFVSDFEYELQMALMNQSLRPGIETFFLVASPERTFVSSSIVKEVARQGRDVSAYVPPVVVAALERKLR